MTIGSGYLKRVSVDESWFERFKAAMEQSVDVELQQPNGDEDKGSRAVLRGIGMAVMNLAIEEKEKKSGSERSKKKGVNN